MKELNLSDEQVTAMVADTARSMAPQVRGSHIKLVASESYGEQAHRTWAFYLGDGLAFGTVERYWGGLKMICSVLGGTPRTAFFTEDGTRTTNTGLRESAGR